MTRQIAVIKQIKNSNNNIVEPDIGVNEAIMLLECAKVKKMILKERITENEYLDLNNLSVNWTNAIYYMEDISAIKNNKVRMNIENARYLIAKRCCNKNMFSYAYNLKYSDAFRGIVKEACGLKPLVHVEGDKLPKDTQVTLDTLYNDICKGLAEITIYGEK